MGSFPEAYNGPAILTTYTKNPDIVGGRGDIRGQFC